MPEDEIFFDRAGGYIRWDDAGGDLLNVDDLNELITVAVEQRNHLAKELGKAQVRVEEMTDWVSFGQQMIAVSEGRASLELTDDGIVFVPGRRELKR